jgi:hypothetical protein
MRNRLYFVAKDTINNNLNKLLSFAIYNKDLKVIFLPLFFIKLDNKIIIYSRAYGFSSRTGVTDGGAASGSAPHSLLGFGPISKTSFRPMPQ